MQTVKQYLCVCAKFNIVISGENCLVLKGSWNAWTNIAVAYEGDIQTKRTYHSEAMWPRFDAITMITYYAQAAFGLPHQSVHINIHEVMTCTYVGFCPRNRLYTLPNSNIQFCTLNHGDWLLLVASTNWISWCSSLILSGVELLTSPLVHTLVNIRAD